MKILFILLLCFNISHASVIVEESAWIKNPSQKTIMLLSSRPEFTIDHMKKNGFELYGPKGMQIFLQENNIEYSSITTQSPDTDPKKVYPSPEEIEKELKLITKSYPKISKLYSIGKSTKNRDLWVMKISKNANTDDSRPEFKYIANMHGDEIIGREIMVLFIKDCLKNYGTDPQITNLLDKVQIHILVSMNPDGAATKTRGNAKYVDLNRDFPDFTTEDNIDSPVNRAPETQAVMKWQAQHKFKLSANFHGGAEVVNYPWDAIATQFPEEYAIKDLSLEYAQHAPYIGASTTFENGITNGFQWYKINGGMQDWSIHWRRDFQITIELSDTKWPDYSNVAYYYEQNRMALIRLIERIETLVRN